MRTKFFPDAQDNCLLMADPDQRDTDGDGYGNACDGDLNNDGAVDNLDLGLFKQRFGGNDPDADLNGDGYINFADLGLFRQLYGKPLGPSGPHGQTGPAPVVYLHTDPLGTPRLATDPQRRVVWRWEGNAFGDTAPDADPDGDGHAVTVNLRYAGQYYDPETGLHYNWHRYYDPKLGRYITGDPIGLVGGLNTFVYAGNRPLRHVDPLGLDYWVYNYPTAGDGYGHVGMIFRNKDGTYTRYSQGADNPDASRWELLTSQRPAVVHIDTVKSPNLPGARVVKITTNHNDQVLKAIDD